MAKKKTVKKGANKIMKNSTFNCNVDGTGCGKGCGGCAYFLGFLGSAVYYISTSVGFGNGVLGFLKALVWPAFLIYEVLKFVGA